ncbi:MAG: hypothetical protein IPH39_02550 [Sulfuritalea sp.]|nr:hypothetical protein [Sulfuritalea sp.]
MEYTQQQVRSAIGVGQQTFRYWKQSLPPLARKSGKTAAFSVGEMLALSVVNHLVQICKIDVSALAPIADDLFKICSRPLLFSRHPTIAWIDLAAKIIGVPSDGREVPTDRVCLIIPLSLLWQQISESLTETDRSGEQRELLPLASVA